MATEVDLTSLSNATSDKITSIKSDVYSRLSELEGLLNSVAIYPDLPSYFFAELTDISFDEIQRAEDIISTVEFTPIPTRDLMPSGEDTMEKGHTFISPSLDNMENNLVSLLEAAGSDNIKDISAAFLSDDDISKIESSYFDYRQSVSNAYNSLMNKYITADTTPNIDWLMSRNEFIGNDFRKDLYSELFKLAQGTTSWIGKQAINIEELHADFTASNNSLLNKLVSANVAAYKAEVEANIAKLENDITEADARIDINNMKFKQKSGELSLQVRQENERRSAYSKDYATSMKVSTENLSTNVGISKAVASSYEAILASHSQRYSGVVLGRQNGE